MLACSDSDAAIRALLVAYPDGRDIEIAAAGLEQAFLQLTADAPMRAASLSRVPTRRCERVGESRRMLRRILTPPRAYARVGAARGGVAAYTRYELLRTFRNRRFFLLSLGFPLILYFVIAVPNRHIHNFAGTGLPRRSTTWSAWPRSGR